MRWQLSREQCTLPWCESDRGAVRRLSTLASPPCDTWQGSRRETALNPSRDSSLCRAMLRRARALLRNVGQRRPGHARQLPELGEGPGAQVGDVAAAGGVHVARRGAGPRGLVASSQRSTWA